VGRPLEETELVARARHGDAAAFEELVRMHQGIAFRTAYLVTAAAPVRLLDVICPRRGACHPLPWRLGSRPIWNRSRARKAKSGWMTSGKRGRPKGALACRISGR
jgi:hypothetical protein